LLRISRSCGWFWVKRRVGGNDALGRFVYLEGTSDLEARKTGGLRNNIVADV